MSAVKALQQWCKIQCAGYRDVSITNMTTSFRDGLAFCALIHKHRPDLINFDSLMKDNVYDNNKLAFQVAEQELGIPALLDAEDMVALKVPDRLSILTYVSQYYNYFHGRAPIGGMAGAKRPAEGSTDEPSGKKNQPVVSKMFPSSRPATENRPPPSSPSAVSPLRPSGKPVSTGAQKEVLVESSKQTGTLSNKCVSCHKHVHLVQRYLVEGRLYHRNCAKSFSPTNSITPLRDLPKNTPLSKYTPHSEPVKTPVSKYTPHSEPVKTPVSKYTPHSEPVKTPVSKYTPHSEPVKTPVSKYTPHWEPVKTPVSKYTPHWEPVKTPVSKYTPHLEPAKTNTPTPTPAPSKLGPSWLTSSTGRSTSPAKTERSRSPATTSNYRTGRSTSPVTSLTSRTERSRSPSTTSTEALSHLRPTSALSSLGTGSRTALDTTTTITTRPTPAPTPTTISTTITARPTPAPTPTTITARPTPAPTPTTITAGPTPAPRTSAAAAKTHEAQLKFFQTGADIAAAAQEDKTPTQNLNTNRGLNVDCRGPQGAVLGQSVTVVVNLAGGDKGKDVSVTGGPGGFGGGVKGGGLGGGPGKVWSKEDSSSSSKAHAAAFISKKLTEESNNNNSKPTWTTVALKKVEKPAAAVETPKKETGGVRGRVKLKADPSLLADSPSITVTPSPASAPANRSGLGTRTPDKGSSQPATSTASPSPNSTPAASDSSECPTDWRSMLKPVSKETKPAGPKQSSPLPTRKQADSPSTPWATGAGKSQATGPAVVLSSTHLPSPPSPRPGTKDFQNGDRSPTPNGTKGEMGVSKAKPDYIPKENILKELDEIEDSLNELEKRGVDLEKRLRHSEEEGQDDSLMDELMVEWFNLIRNKQVAMRRESELVYIARTQDLEEQQPSVEQELRRLMEKPEHMKTLWDKRREEELMAKLVEIVNDRSAIVDGLDEDRLREDEEDEQLNKMMMNLDIKKEKVKKKSPMAKLFGWGNKKEG